MSDFSYLHVHTHFSRGGGPASPAQWCKRAAQLGYKSLAIADRAPLTGLPAFIEVAQAEGLIPICGVELDVLLPSDGGKANSAQTATLLFARDKVGMANLSRLCAVAYAGWPSSEASVEWDVLVKHSAGLALVLLGEEETEGASPFLGLPDKKLAELGGVLKEHFGDAAFVGMSHTGLPEDTERAAQVASAAAHMALPLVAALSARYLHPEDAASYAALQSAREQAGWSKIRNTQYAIRTSDFLRSPDEASALFSEWPSAVENVARVVELCAGAGLGAAEWKLRPAAQELDAESQTLGNIAERRLLELLGEELLQDDVRARLDAELHVVARCGRAPAWLALGSIANFARVNRVPLGAPLGMADGALLSYALGVSSLNPMPYARPAWLSGADGEGFPPLPGVEVSSAKRAIFISALAKEYGAERVVHAACSVDVPPVDAAQAALLTSNVQGDDARLFLARVMEHGWSAFDTSAPDVAPEHVALSNLALSLQGAPLYFKPDPNTLVIAPTTQGDDANSASSLVRITSLPSAEAGRWVPWTEDTLCRLSYPAISLHPSNALTTLDNALTFGGKHPVPGFSAASVDLLTTPQPDEATSALITNGEVAGIPYVTPKAAKGWTGGLTPEGIAALVAHSAAKHKIRNTQYAIRNLEGDLLYRDQADTLIELAGLSPEEAAILYRSLLKPDLDADSALRSRLLDGLVQSGMGEEAASELKDTFLASGHGLISRYAAHAWGRVALWSATVKAAHPAALIAGALVVAWERGLRTHVAALAAEAHKLGVTILPPDVNRSLTSISLEREGASWAVRWGLALLPSWDRGQAERFLAARPPQGIATLRDFALVGAAAGLSQLQVESLAQSGACDNLGGQPRDRRALIEASGSMLEWAQSNTPASGQVDLFTAVTSQEAPVEEAASLADGSPSPNERHGYRTWEESNLGVAFTQADEIDALRQALKDSGDLQARLLPTSQIKSDHVGQSVLVVGILCGVQFLQSPPSDNGHGASADEMPMAVAQVEDLEGSIELVAFPPNYKRHKRLWVENNLLIITARVCRHIDGSLYLLCEHLLPFQGDDVEEELSFKVKVGRSAARPMDTLSDSTSPNGVAKDPLAHTEIIAAPKSGASQSGAHGSYSQAQPGNGNGYGGTNGNGHGNGHSGNGATVGAQARTVAAQATGTPVYRLIISLPFSTDDRTDIDTMISLNSILMDHPGADIITLRIPYSPEPKAVTYAHLPRGARYNSHLESRLHKLLGPDALAVIKLEG